MDFDTEVHYGIQYDLAYDLRQVHTFSVSFFCWVRIVFIVCFYVANDLTGL